MSTPEKSTSHEAEVSSVKAPSIPSNVRALAAAALIGVGGLVGTPKDVNAGEKIAPQCLTIRDLDERADCNDKAEKAAQKHTKNKPEHKKQPKKIKPTPSAIAATAPTTSTTIAKAVTSPVSAPAPKTEIVCAKDNDSAEHKAMNEKLATAVEASLFAAFASTVAAVLAGLALRRKKKEEEKV